MNQRGFEEWRFCVVQYLKERWNIRKETIRIGTLVGIMEIRACQIYRGGINVTVTRSLWGRGTSTNYSPEKVEIDRA